MEVEEEGDGGEANATKAKRAIVGIRER